MDLGKVLGEVSTCNQWSVLDSVLKKVQRKMKGNAAVNREDLIKFLQSKSKSELQTRGIWYEGVKTDVIICINPAFGRARKAEIRESGKCNTSTCLCSRRSKVKKNESMGGGGDDERRYFNSHDYNGGRHASTQSKHIGSCPLWKPASSGHLHSWRRKFSTSNGRFLRTGRTNQRAEKLSRGKGGRAAAQRAAQTREEDLTKMMMNSEGNYEEVNYWMIRQRFLNNSNKEEGSVHEESDEDDEEYVFLNSSNESDAERILKESEFYNEWLKKTDDNASLVTDWISSLWILQVLDSFSTSFWKGVMNNKMMVAAITLEVSTILFMDLLKFNYISGLAILLVSLTICKKVLFAKYNRFNEYYYHGDIYTGFISTYAWTSVIGFLITLMLYGEITKVLLWLTYKELYTLSIVSFVHELYHFIKHMNFTINWTKVFDDHANALIGK